MVQERGGELQVKYRDEAAIRIAGHMAQTCLSPHGAGAFSKQAEEMGKSELEVVAMLAYQIADALELESAKPSTIQ